MKNKIRKILEEQINSQDEIEGGEEEKDVPVGTSDMDKYLRGGGSLGGL